MRKIVTIIFLMSVAAPHLLAAHRLIGSTGEQLLNVAVDARSSGMGRAFAAVGEDTSAVFYNPAGLGALYHSELAGSKSFWFEDINHTYAGFAYNLHDVRTSNIVELGTVYAGIMTLDASGTVTSTAAASAFAPKDQVIYLAYGKPVFEREDAGSITAGIAVKFYKEEAGAVKSEGQAFDAGALWNAADKSFSAGISVQNIGDPIRHAGADVELPLNVKTGVAARFLDNRLLAAFDVNTPRTGEAVFNVGGEWWFLQAMALRAGYDSRTGQASGVSAGLGIRLQQVDVPLMYAHELTIDYSVTPYGDKGNVHRLGLGLKFGAE